MSELDQTFDVQNDLQRYTIFRVYNYYRIVVAFLLLYLFSSPNLSEFVGSVNEDLFRNTVIFYVMINVLVGIATLFTRVEYLAGSAPSFVIVTIDIACLVLMMSASGGVSSGLGNFIIFSLAFGGGLIRGRVSTVLPAIAFILTIYDEFYLFFLGENEVQAFFRAGLLGIVFFFTNILFQTLARRLQSSESEVQTLGQINRLIIERMRTGVVVLTDGPSPKLINKAAEDLLWVPGQQTSPAEHLPEVILRKAVEWSESQSPETIHIAAYDGGPEITANFSSIDARQSSSGVLVYLEDSTEIQRQAQQLKLASVGRLSASIAHEIRNPLGAISHAAQLLSESDNLDKGDERLCEIIQDHSVRMNGVIENILQMSRRKTAEPKQLNLAEWLNRFIEDFTAGESEPIQIETDSITHDFNFMADPLHLSQVVGNLCQNGLRYSKKKTGEARVKVEAGIDADTRRPYISVSDYGEGVSDELIPNLFEPFYTTETTGTGLGLYLSKELCEANEARLSYSRADTGGSCFRVTFLTEIVN